MAGIRITTRPTIDQASIALALGFLTGKLYEAGFEDAAGIVHIFSRNVLEGYPLDRGLEQVGAAAEAQVTVNPSTVPVFVNDDEDEDE